MKVYVLTRGDYCGSTDQAHLHGVFSTPGKAAAANKPDAGWAKINDGKEHLEYEVHELELDVPLEKDVRLV